MRGDGRDGKGGQGKGREGWTWIFVQGPEFLVSVRDCILYIFYCDVSGLVSVKRSWTEFHRSAICKNLQNVRAAVT